MENLQIENPQAFENAHGFLVRYGINNDKRPNARKGIYLDIKNHLSAKQINDDLRERDHFKYRYIYDFCMKLRNLQL
jgi:hypothetical protein